MRQKELKEVIAVSYTHLDVYKRQENLVRLAFAKKVKVAPGSDAGAYMVSHGKGICQEYEAFCQILGDRPEVREWLQGGECEIRERFRRK